MNSSQRRKNRRVNPVPLSCGYQGYHFGANYLDGFCEGGFIHDADADGYDPTVAYMPCPSCNTEKYKEWITEMNDG